MPVSQPSPEVTSATRGPRRDGSRDQPRRGLQPHSPALRRVPGHPRRRGQLRDLEVKVDRHAWIGFVLQRECERRFHLLLGRSDVTTATVFCGTPTMFDDDPRDVSVV